MILNYLDLLPNEILDIIYDFVYIEYKQKHKINMIQISNELDSFWLIKHYLSYSMNYDRSFTLINKKFMLGFRSNCRSISKNLVKSLKESNLSYIKPNFIKIIYSK